MIITCNLKKIITMIKYKYNMICNTSKKTEKIVPRGRCIAFSFHENIPLPRTVRQMLLRLISVQRFPRNFVLINFYKV